MYNIEVFDQITFYQRFEIDLSNAKSLVLIQSPFVSENRLSKIERSLKDCIQRNVRVCVFLQQPEPDSHQERAVSAGYERLASMGIHVNVRKFIHEKIAIIDESILWDGSLNILSHNRSSERMTRWADQEAALAAIRRHGLYRCDHCAQLQTSASSIEKQVALIGRLLAERRKSLKISQSELAKCSGLSQTMVSNIERGHGNQPLSSVIRACRALNLDLRPVPWYAIRPVQKRHEVPLAN